MIYLSRHKSTAIIAVWLCDSVAGRRWIVYSVGVIGPGFLKKKHRYTLSMNMYVVVFYVFSFVLLLLLFFCCFVYCFVNKRTKKICGTKTASSFAFIEP